MSAVRIRNTVALIIALAAGAVVSGRAVLGTSDVTVQSFELLLPGVPLLVSVVGLACFAFVPRFTEPLGFREASLDVRDAFTFSPRQLIGWVLASMAVLMALVVALGFAADDSGRAIDGAGPFPGVAYGGPVSILLLLLGATAGLVLWRLSTAPRPSDVGLRRADSELRVSSSRAVLVRVVTATTATITSVLFMAGSATAHAGNGAIVDAAGDVVPGNPMLPLLGTVELTAAGLAMVVTVVLFVKLVVIVTGRSYAPLRDGIASEPTRADAA